jgi:hypothetical protein
MANVPLRRRNARDGDHTTPEKNWLVMTAASSP